MGYPPYHYVSHHRSLNTVIKVSFVTLVLFVLYSFNRVVNIDIQNTIQTNIQHQPKQTVKTISANVTSPTKKVEHRLVNLHVTSTEVDT